MKIKVILFLILVTYIFSSCNSSAEPIDNGKLPFGIFPLNDVKWVCKGTGGPPEYSDVYDQDSNIVGYMVATSEYIDTLFVHQVGESKAELHASGIHTTHRIIQYYGSSSLTQLPDSIWTIGPHLTAWIYLENRKVYYQGRRVDQETGEIVISDTALMYDFNLQLNDTFWVGGYSFGDSSYYRGHPYNTGSIDSVLVGNEYRKRYNFFDLGEYLNKAFSVIEGIGFDGGDLLAMWRLEMAIDRDQLVGVFHKDKKIYPMGGK